MGVKDMVWLLTKKFPRQIREWARVLIHDKAPVLFQTRRKAILIGLAAAALAAILGFAGAALARSQGRAARAAVSAGELTESFKPLPIPPEDFFLPEEPDALPAFIPARPQRETWTAEDAAEYWTDPLAGKEALWRDRFGAAAAELLEAVP
ncbi:MAG: hypothetical protein LBK63_00950 [Treponema sp.]|jgi:hypothetical protein|nr:hypothetical protein [Treponema sp.]